MLDTPQIIQITAQPTAIIRLTIPKDEIQAVMEPGLSELMAAIGAQGIAPAAPWFTHHLRIEPDIWDFEISVPVTKPVDAAGRVTPSHWPAMRAARTIYHGTYEGLGNAWREFMDWIALNGHTPAEDLWERYLVGPESGSNPATWRTELTKPLKN
ncbi:MAG TPA: GyrI-like domain-containing protein [Terrimicrobiaceae bacterium]